MELTIAFASFIALVAAWFVMPGSPRTAASHSPALREHTREAA